MTSPLITKFFPIGAALTSLVLLSSLVAAPLAQAESPPQRIVSGWIPYWMSSQSKPQGINNAVNNADLFSDVSPFWYSATATGGGNVKLGFNSNFGGASSNAAWATAQLRAAGIPILPAIADAAGKGRMASVLADPAKRAAHVGDIVNLVMSNNYDGIDLDYEKFAFSDGRSSWDATKPNWTAFVAELGTALKAQGKKLSVTIPPPCSMGGTCGGNNGYYVYNMEGIAPYADLIRIMAYDYSYSAPGPIAPYDWVRSIVAYTAGVVDPSKVQIGVPTYGRFWTERKAGGGYQFTGTCPRASSSGSEKSAYNSLISRGSMTDVDIPAFIAEQGGAAEWDDSKKENFFRYTKKVNWTDSSGANQTCTAKRIMWFVGPRGILARTQLVGEFGIKGAALWTIGGDNPEQWPLIRSYAQSLAPATPDVGVEAPSAIVFGTDSVVTTSGKINGAPIVGTTAILQKSQGKSWVDVASGVTGADGAVAIPFSLDRSGTFRILMSATPTTPEVTSADFRITVSSAVTARAKTPKVKRGGNIKVKVVARPAVKGQRVVLQRNIGGTWKKEAKTTVKPNGRIVIRDKAPSQKGRYSYRVVAKPRAGVLAGVSGEFIIRVT